MSNGVDVDIHMSVLARWFLNTLGKAVGVAVFVAFAGGVIAALVGEPILYALAGLGGPLAFAIVLYDAAPPYPKN